MNEKQWDVFISHASEDKETVAEPLAGALSRLGARVWLDKQQLEIGDSLSEKIDEGLSKSQFGIVIFSKAFFSKHWPKKELAGLRSREDAGRKLILPVWHGVAKTDVVEFSPILADVLAGNTSQGIDQLATALAKSLFGPGGSSQPSLARKLVEVLEGGEPRENLVDFLKASQRLVDFERIFGPYPRFEELVIGDVPFDVVSTYTGHGTEHTFIHLSEFWKDPFYQDHSGRSHILKPLLSRIEAIKSASAAVPAEIHHWLIDEAARRDEIYSGENQEAWYKRFRDRDPRKKFIIYCGRRSYINKTDERTAIWGDARTDCRESDIAIHSYDEILDLLLPFKFRQY